MHGVLGTNQEKRFGEANSKIIALLTYSVIFIRFASGFEGWHHGRQALWGSCTYDSFCYSLGSQLDLVGIWHQSRMNIAINKTNFIRKNLGKSREAWMVIFQCAKL